LSEESLDLTGSDGHSTPCTDPLSDQQTLRDSVNDPHHLSNVDHTKTQPQKVVPATVTKIGLLVQPGFSVLKSLEPVLDALPNSSRWWCRGGGRQKTYLGALCLPPPLGDEKVLIFNV